MTIRTINFTGRSNITSSGESAEVKGVFSKENDSGFRNLSLKLSLRENQYNEFENCKLFCELKYDDYYESKNLGMTEKTRDEPLRVNDLNIDANNTKIRLTFVNSDSGLISARSNYFHPEIESDDNISDIGPTESFFKIIENRNMDATWKIEVERGDRPKLQISKKSCIYNELLSGDKSLQATIFPAALRELLLVYIETENASDDRWRKIVLNYADDLIDSDTNETPSWDGYFVDNDTQKFVDKVIEEYCKRMGFNSSLVENEL